MEKVQKPSNSKNAITNVTISSDGMKAMNKILVSVPDTCLLIHAHNTFHNWNAAHAANFTHLLY
jgi:hypothetical protein